MQTPDRPATPDPAAGPLTARLLAAWWHFGQVMKRRVAPRLVREHGLDFGEYVHLSAIEAGAVHPGTVCERVASSPSGVSRMLEALERRDLVRRSLDPDDSRRVLLEITPSGAVALRATRAAMIAALDGAMRDMPDAEVEAFARTLERLADRMAVTEEPAQAQHAPHRR